MSPRGGSRNGTAGKPSANRTDLLTPKPLPATAATGQPYGVAGQQMAAQSAVPMASAPINASANPALSNTQGPPSNLTDPLAPTQRPNESLMTGVNDGALQSTLPNSPTATALSLLQSLGTKVSPQVALIRNYLLAQSQNETPF